MATTFTVNPDKAAQLEHVSLDRGRHDTFDDGHCAMETVAWLADLGQTDAPECTSPFLRRYVIQLNDRFDTKRRQDLKLYLVRMVGTHDDGKDLARERIAARYTGSLVAPWLRLAGLDDYADKAAGIATRAEARGVLRAASQAAWALRLKTVSEFRVKVSVDVKTRLAATTNPVDDGAVDAAADAAVDAATAVVIDAATSAISVVIDAATVILTDSNITVITDAVAAVVAHTEDAVENAVQAATSVGQSTRWGKLDGSIYMATRAYYAAHPPSIPRQIADLAVEQSGAALDLLDKLIDADEGH